MEFIEVIKDYLENKATAGELIQINTLLKLKQAPQFVVNQEVTRQNIIDHATKMYNGENKLQVVKFVKEWTGMGLREAKDWCDLTIFINYKPLV